VSIETCSGPAVERLLALGCRVYPINPRSARAYRTRKAPSGTKDDALDAWSFADALRTDGHAWRPLTPEDPLTQQLRLLCRDEVALIGQRTALVCQLREALHEYYPAALEAFDDWTMRAAWEFIIQFPTPQQLAGATRRKRQSFLTTHKLHSPQTQERRLAIFARADQFCGSPAVTQAKSLLAVGIAKQLITLEAVLKQYRQRIEELFRQHPDHELFGSLPGLGDKLAPRMLGECGDDPARFEDHQALQCYAGTAPVSYDSGQKRMVKIRRACNKHLRAAVHLWADLSRRQCAWAQAYYEHKCKQGKTHAEALRCLGQRWLKILHRMIQTKQPYDESLHMRNQVAHGSWVIRLTEPDHQLLKQTAP